MADEVTTTMTAGAASRALQFLTASRQTGVDENGGLMLEPGLYDRQLPPTAAMVVARVKRAYETAVGDYSAQRQELMKRWSEEHELEEGDRLPPECSEVLEEMANEEVAVAVRQVKYEEILAEGVTFSGRELDLLAPGLIY